MKTKLKSINWTTVAAMSLMHLLVLGGLPLYFYYFDLKSGILISAIALFFLTGLGITAGYHRFYAHRAYNLNKGVEFFLLFFATLAFQLSVLQWAYKHRIHHRYVDQENDPYAITKGFWYAHILWIFEENEPIDMNQVRDLAENKMVMFQHRHDIVSMLVSNILVLSVPGLIFHDFLGAFFIAGVVRIFVLYHVTFCINSIAHTWGTQNYSKEFSAVNNYLVSLLTFGEGYHNYHHTFASDYRNGIKWYHFDPGKWLVWTLRRFGLATEVKEMPEFIIQKRLITEDKRTLLEKLQDLASSKKQELEQKVNTCYANLIDKLSELSELRKTADVGGRVRAHIQSKKKQFHNELNAWVQLYKGVMRLKGIRA